MLVLVLGQVADIFQSRWIGVEVQSFTPAGNPVCIYKFTTSGPDAQGYVSLIAHATDGTFGEIVRFKNIGMEVQGFDPDPLGTFYYCIQNFTTSGPDAQGYVSLIAHASNATSGAIIRGRWIDFKVQDFNALGCSIKGFIASGPDINGFVTLSVDTTCTITPVGTNEEHVITIPVDRKNFEVFVRNMKGKVMIELSIPYEGNVSLSIYNIAGRKIFQFSDKAEEGILRIVRNLPKGAYVLRAEFEGIRITRSFVSF